MVDDNHQPVLEPLDYIEALLKRRINLWKLKKSDKAIEDLKKALSIYSETPLSKRPLETTEADMHFSLAEIYSENENFSETLIHFKRAFSYKTLTRIYKAEDMRSYIRLIREDGNFLLRGEDKAQALLVAANNTRLERDFKTCTSFNQQAFELLSEIPNPSQDLFRFARTLKTYA